MTNEIVLHHFPVSHYAEKIRRILAYKGLPWRSVEQPLMMPKPFLTPLTGGYRRIPVMQIGADIYCDSACIARRIEQLYPEPPVLPPELADLATIIEDWADRRFMWQALLPGFVDLSEFLPPDVMDDRAKMSPELTKENFFNGAPHALSQALQSMQHLNGMLGDKPFLLGEKFSLADASCYFVLFFMAHSQRVFVPAIARYPTLHAWYERVRSLGRIDATPMSNEEALTIARTAEPQDIAGGIGNIEGIAMAESFAIGDHISVVADDYGTEEVLGKLVRVTATELAVLRKDDELGNIAVHFPRIGYRLRRI